jgi:hypothetical protein
MNFSERLKRQNDEIMNFSLKSQTNQQPYQAPIDRNWDPYPRPFRPIGGKKYKTRSGGKSKRQKRSFTKRRY